MEYAWLVNRIGYHVVFDESIEDAIGYAARNGFTSIQVDLNMPAFFPERFTADHRARIRDVAARTGVTITLHAPELALQSLHRTVLHAILRRLEEIIAFARAIRARSVTVHPGPAQTFNVAGEPPQRVPEMDPDAYRERFGGALRALARCSDGAPFLCIENKAFTPLLMDVLRAVMRSDALYLTWDLAKMYRRDGTVIEDVEAFYVANLERIREVHLHDVTAAGQHQLVGTGFVEFAKYLALTRDRDMNYTIEVRPRGFAKMSLAALTGTLERSVRTADTSRQG
jgi:sugar phosphate isomerase/epimerase